MLSSWKSGTNGTGKWKNNLEMEKELFKHININIKTKTLFPNLTKPLNTHIFRINCLLIESEGKELWKWPQPLFLYWFIFIYFLDNFRRNLSPICIYFLMKSYSSLSENVKKRAKNLNYVSGKNNIAFSDITRDIEIGFHEKLENKWH